MTFENKAPEALEDNQALTDNTADNAATQLVPTFKALPKFLLATDDELQPEFTHTPRPKQSS